MEVAAVAVGRDLIFVSVYGDTPKHKGDVLMSR